MTPRGDTAGLNKNSFENNSWRYVLYPPIKFRGDRMNSSRENCDANWCINFHKTPPGGAPGDRIGKLFENNQWGTKVNKCTKFRANISDGYWGNCDENKSWRRTTDAKESTLHLQLRWPSVKAELKSNKEQISTLEYQHLQRILNKSRFQSS